MERGCYDRALGGDEEREGKRGWGGGEMSARGGRRGSRGRGDEKGRRNEWVP